MCDWNSSQRTMKEHTIPGLEIWRELSFRSRGGYANAFSRERLIGYVTHKTWIQNFLKIVNRTVYTKDMAI